MIVLFTGKRASGTTLSMVEQFRKVIAMPIPLTIWSNMHFNSAKESGITVHRFSSFQEIIFNRKFAAKPTHIFWDMAYELFQAAPQKVENFLSEVQICGTTLYLNVQKAEYLPSRYNQFFDFQLQVTRSPQGRIRTISYKYKAPPLYPFYDTTETVGLFGKSAQLKVRT